MSVSAVVQVVQFLPDSSSLGVHDNTPDSECSVFVKDYLGDNESDYRLYCLCAVQNPSPSMGRVGYITSEADTWSDSPLNSPSLNDKYRYGYGRFGTRYRHLDNSSGVIIRDRDFSKSGQVAATDIIFTGDGYVRDISLETEGELLMQEHERKYGDVTINQYDFIVSASPVPFSYRNPIDSDVWIKLSNYVYPLSSGTVTLEINGENKTPLEIIPFYTGLGGFTATWSNDENFSYDSQVDVVWRVYDEGTPPNEIVFSYWFRTVGDYTGPRVVSTEPVDDEIDVSVDTCVEFTVRDFETGVNINTLELYVNNVLVELDQLTYEEVSTGDGYVVSFCPGQNFMYGDTVAVSIYIEDNATEPNYLFHVYSFTTEQSVPPVVVSHEPVACRENKPIDVDVEINVVDGGHGLDDETIDMSVDEYTGNPRKLPIIYRES